MDENAFKILVKRLQEVSAIVEKLDPAIRAEAFSLLRPYVIGSTSRGSSGSKTLPAHESDPVDAESFFSKHTGGKPSENAFLCAAYLYGEFGSEPFSVDEVKELADNAGVTVPDRLDMTFAAAKRDGRTLFRRGGKGHFIPTVHGEAFLKKTYAVNKGRRKK